MQYSPSLEPNLFSATQFIPGILWNPKVHYPHSEVLFLSHLVPVRTPTFNFLNIDLNIIFSSTPVYSKLTPSLTFPYQSPVRNSPLPRICYMSRPSHSSLFSHQKNIW